MSQKDDGDHKEKVEELAEDKSSKIYVISAAALLNVFCLASIIFTYCEYSERKIEPT